MSNLKKNMVKINKQTLLGFLSEHRTEDKNEITHTGWGGKYKGKYSIPENKNEIFHKLYYKECIADKNINELSLIEKHKEVSPILIDIDLNYNENVDKRLHTIDHIKKIVELYMFEIKRTFILNNKSEDLMAFIFQRSKPYKSKGITKDGIHIFFPFIISEPSVQYIIRENVIKKCNNDKILNDLPYINKLTEIFDRTVIYTNGWFMYGSSKPQCSPYRLTNIFNEKLENLEPDEINYRDISDFAKFLSIRRHKKEDETPIKNEKIEEINKLENKQATSRLGKMKKINSSIYDIKQINQLLEILSERRYEEEPLWIEVGWCLHNIDNENIDLLNLWIEFSKKSKKFKNGECEKSWNKFNKDGKLLGIGSLHYWARKDNFEKYMDIIREDIKYYVDKSLNCTNYDIARVLYEMFKYQYVCVSSKSKLWYEFKDHRWYECDDGIGLRKKISTDLVKEYCRIISSYNERMGKIDNDNDLSSEEKEKEKTKCEERTKVLTNIVIKLKTTTFKDNVMRECKELFHEKDFLNKLDENNYLIGFEDGVYDLTAGEFRDGRPDDYISMSTKNYYLEYDENNELINDVKQFIKQVIPNYNVRHYVMKLFASSLQGYNAEEKFRIWTGCHAKGTEIMMSDGKIKKVEDIAVGDKLMGDDSKPRNVLKLLRDKCDMYEITPVKGEPFVVNGDHILCLKATKIGSVCLVSKENRWKVSWHEKDLDGYPITKGKNFPYKYENKQIYKKNVTYYENKEEAHQAALKFNDNVHKNNNTINQNDIIEIPVREYIKRLSKIGARNYFCYRVSVNFDEKKIDLDPYLLGYWIGDGTSAGSSITTMDEEVIEYYQRKIDEMELSMRKGAQKSKAATYHIKGNVNKNSFLKALQDYDLINNKHIPYEYKCNTRDIRLKVLAGIMDSDGHYQEHTKQYELTMKSEKIIDDVVYLCRSLGFACYKRECKKKCTNGKNGPVEGTYYRIQISGDNLKEIPCILKRKMANDRMKNKNVLLYGIKINKIENDNYFGFTLDSNHRYLSADFTCHHNCGGNGKSKIIELLRLAYGGYADSFPITLFTGKRASSNAATPEVASSKGKRFMQIDEPEEGANINVGLMKNYSGNDLIKARSLFKEPIEFKPQFKMVLICNELPKVPPYDGATWRRMEVVEFTSKFVEDPKEENEYQRDNQLSQKLKEWKETFMSILLDYYKIYKKEGIIAPYEVTKFTKEYQNNCDIYSEFISGILLPVDDKKVYLNIGDIYREFKVWYTETNPNSRMIPKKDVKLYLEKKFGKNNITNDCLKGFILKKKEANFTEQSENIDSDNDDNICPDTHNLEHPINE